MRITRRNFLIGLSVLPVIGKSFTYAAQKPEASVDTGGITYPAKLVLMNGDEDTPFTHGVDLLRETKVLFENIKGEFTGYRVVIPTGLCITKGTFARKLWVQKGDTITIFHKINFHQL